MIQTHDIIDTHELLDHSLAPSHTINCLCLPKKIPTFKYNSKFITEHLESSVTTSQVQTLENVTHKLN